jgi:hypothetical protein
MYKSEGAADVNKSRTSSEFHAKIFSQMRDLLSSVKGKET